MKRSVHVIPTLHHGGAERLLEEVALAELAEGTEVLVVTLMGDTDIGRRLARAGARVVSLRSSGAFASRSWLREAIRALRSSGARVVYGWLYHGALFATLLSARPARLVGVIHHHSPRDRGLSWRTRQVARLVAARSGRFESFIYVSEGSRDQHRSAGFRAPGVVIPGGVNLSRFSLPSEREKRIAREALAIPGTAPVVVHVGRWHQDKDQTTLLRAFTLFATNSNAVLVLAGRGMDADGPAGAYARELGILDRIRLVGERDEVRDVLVAGDVFVLSSRTEALPVSLLEAMAVGLVPLVTNVGSCAMAVGGAGVVVPPEDHTALAAGLREAFAKVEGSNPEAPRGQAERFGSDRMCARYLAISKLDRAGER